MDDVPSYYIVPTAVLRLALGARDRTTVHPIVDAQTSCSRSMLAFQAPVMADHVVTIPVQKIDAGMCPPPSPQPTQPCALTEDFYANPALHT